MTNPKRIPTCGEGDRYHIKVDKRAVTCRTESEAMTALTSRLDIDNPQGVLEQLRDTGQGRAVSGYTVGYITDLEFSGGVSCTRK